ncbi:MAG: PAQR family membrane homeostasis protein TrhA [Thermoplasmatota archaeon]
MALREPFNSVSHMAGAGLAIVAVPFLVARASSPLALFSVALYGLALVAVFTMSAVYHAITHHGAARWLFRLDQATIYLLIAGTYTPVALLVLSGVTGWLLFGVEWALAVTGVVLLLTVHRTPQWIHQAAYIMLGWAAVVALPRLWGFDRFGLALLAAGGLMYTGGSFLYNRDRDDTWGIGDHGLWHLLVLGGAIAHYVFVFAYVL